MQRHDDSHILLMCQHLQDVHELCLALYVQKRRWLVQKQNLRLLADRAGQQHALALAVADPGKIAVLQLLRPDKAQGVMHLLPVGIGQNAQPPGVGVAPGGGDLKAGRQLGAGRVGQHQRQLARPGVRGVGRQVLPVQQHRAALRRQLPGQRF